MQGVQTADCHNLGKIYDQNIQPELSLAIVSDLEYVQSCTVNQCQGMHKHMCYIFPETSHFMGMANKKCTGTCASGTSRWDKHNSCHGRPPLEFAD